jgi:hypothetical protein
MRTLVIIRNASSIYAVAILLCACGGASVPNAIAGNSVDGAQAQQNKQRFDYTGSEQSFVVPSGVTKLSVVAFGAAGAGDTYPSNYDEVPGYGGRVSAVVPVQSGETLYVFVGGEPAKGASGTGGFNGGGNGGYGGGGASDIREGSSALSDRILVAGGGGGAGASGLYVYSGRGGDGGDATGGSGSAGGGRMVDGQGATGGSQSAGGPGGAPGKGSAKTKGQTGAAGSLAAGGNGGHGGAARGRAGFRGGSGGGGGGGAGRHYGVAPGAGGGGGGGSSYAESTAKKYVSKQGVWRHNGVVIISW